MKKRIIKNQTASRIIIEDLDIWLEPGKEFELYPAGDFSLDEISASNDLRTKIDEGSIVLFDGVRDLSATEAKALLDEVIEIAHIRELDDHIEDTKTIENNFSIDISGTGNVSRTFHEIVCSTGTTTNSYATVFSNREIKPEDARIGWKSIAWIFDVKFSATSGMDFMLGVRADAANSIHVRYLNPTQITFETVEANKSEASTVDFTLDTNYHEWTFQADVDKKKIHLYIDGYYKATHETYVPFASVLKMGAYVKTTEAADKKLSVDRIRICLNRWIHETPTPPPETNFEEWSEVAYSDNFETWTEKAYSDNFEAWAESTVGPENVEDWT